MSILQDIGHNRQFMEELHQQLATNIGVVPFVGAGLCVACGLPEWSALLRQLGGACGESAQIERLIHDGLYEEAAGLLEQSFGSPSFSASLRARLSGNAVQRLAGAILQTPALTRGPVVTTNLDCVLEQVFERAGHPFASVGLGPHADVVFGALHQDRPFLIKIHGGLDDPLTRVLTLEDYHRAYGSRDAHHVRSELPLPRLLEQIFTSRTLLFLGCSLNLDRTLIYLSRVRREHAAPARHFAVLPDPGNESVRSERTRFLADLNIRPIWYPSQRHELIGDLLEEIMEPRFKPPFRASPPTDAARLGGCISIDFGTSFSAVAFCPDGKGVEYVRPLANNDRILIPTVVRLLEGLQYTIGDEHPGPGSHLLAEFRNFKRLLGSDHRYRVGRREYSARDLTALFLKGLRIAMEDQFDGPLPTVVAAIPANFSARQVADLTRALRRSGLRIARLVAEPCAAGLNTWEDLGEDENVFLVVDIGGGTTDVSVIIGSGEGGDCLFQVIAVTGDNELGGLDFDDVLCQLVRTKLSGDLGARGVTLFERHRVEIESQVSSAKISLNSHESAAIVLADVETQPGDLTSVAIDVDRRTYHEACRPLMRRLEKLIDVALQQWNRYREEQSPANSSALVPILVLAGQTSKLAPVRAFLESKRMSIVDRFQDIAVARGLAHQAAVLSGNRKDLLLMDVTYQGIYLACRAGVHATQLRRETEAGAPTLRDASGRAFIELYGKNVMIPFFVVTRLTFESPLNSIELELFESGDDPNRPFQPVHRRMLRFAAPAFWVDLEIHVDPNRAIHVALTTGSVPPTLQTIHPKRKTLDGERTTSYGIDLDQDGDGIEL